jgi:hypothetical protein
MYPNTITKNSYPWISSRDIIKDVRQENRKKTALGIRHAGRENEIFRYYLATVSKISLQALLSPGLDG